MIEMVGHPNGPFHKRAAWARDEAHRDELKKIGYICHPHAKCQTLYYCESEGRKVNKLGPKQYEFADDGMRLTKVDKEGGKDDT